MANCNPVFPHQNMPEAVITKATSQQSLEKEEKMLQIAIKHQNARCTARL